MDLSTRFPEVILRKIRAKVIAEALVQFFKRYGLPKDIQSDQGSNFMSVCVSTIHERIGDKAVEVFCISPTRSPG